MRLTLVEAALAAAETRQASYKRRGFVVAWNWYDGQMLVRDSTPDIRAGDSAYATEDEAWALANRIAAAAEFVGDKRGRIVDITVLDASGAQISKRVLRPQLGRLSEADESVVAAR